MEFHTLSRTSPYQSVEFHNPFCKLILAFSNWMYHNPYIDWKWQLCRGWISHILPPSNIVSCVNSLSSMRCQAITETHRLASKLPRTNKKSLFIEAKMTHLNTSMRLVNNSKIMIMHLSGAKPLVKLRNQYRLKVLHWSAWPLTISFVFVLKFHFLPQASFGLRVLSSAASVGLCVSVCLCVCQSRACPHDNSSLIQARVTKFGPEMLNTLV